MTYVVGLSTNVWDVANKHTGAVPPTGEDSDPASTGGVCNNKHIIADVETIWVGVMTQQYES